MQIKEYYLALFWCLIAVFFDVLYQGILASFIVSIIGLSRAYKAIVKEFACHSGWRMIFLKSAAPMVLAIALPSALLLGWSCQNIALSKAEQLRLTLLEKLQKEDLYQAYNELCPYKCGFLSYTIMPGKLLTSEGKGFLIVMQFGGHRAKVDIESGKIETDERTY